VHVPTRAGARGYVLKGAQQDEVVPAIQAVAAGEAIFGPGIARQVLGLAAAPPAPGVSVPGPDQPGTRGALPLSPPACANAEIARQPPKTVANHISAIFNKLQVADRSQVIILARDAGLGRNDSATRTGSHRSGSPESVVLRSSNLLSSATSR
jgi:DNA-binding NarL/FixJ family response regulator